VNPDEINEIKRLTGMTDAEIDEHMEAAHEALHQMGHLISFWANIMEAQEAGNTAVVHMLSHSASSYISELDETTLRWIVSAATKAIAQKMRSDYALQDVDAVSAAEEILKNAAADG
jgi:hypothetical protein